MCAGRAIIKKYVHLFAGRPDETQEADMPSYVIYMESDQSEAVAPYSLSSVEKKVLDMKVE